MPDQNENSAESLRTLARSMRKALYECARCNRKFNVANARPDGIYKCVSCNIVMNPISEQAAATIRAEDVEMILDDAIPGDVQNALKNPENVHGKFVLLEKLGEGGMGAVFKAFDVELSRYVALKFIKSQQAAELRAEAKTLASLEHKNIARIYEIGTDFIAMQLIRGKQIAKWDDMVAVCEAVDYAHKRGIVHRDIKPENIMVDEEGNVFVMDFGLAVKGASDEFAGTPGYIAPELVGSIQGDVYSLGATMYTLITGRRPMEFSNEEGIQTVIAKCRDGVTPPLPNDEPGAIIRKAMAFKPADRYQTAHEMANDIRCYLRGEPVKAFSNSATYRIRKLMKRKSALFATAALAAIGIAIAGAIAFQNYKEKQSKDELARQEQENARKAREELHKQIEENLNSLRAQAKIALDKILEARKKKEPGAINSAYSTLKEILEYNFDRVIEKAPDLAEPYFIMGRIERAIIQLDKAMDWQKKALKLDEKYASALYEYAVLTAWKYDRGYEETRQRLVRERTGQMEKMEAGSGYKEPTNEEILAANTELVKMQVDIRKSIERMGIEKVETKLVSPAAREAALGIMWLYVGEPFPRYQGIEHLKNALERDREMEEVFSALTRFAEEYDEKEKYATQAVETLPGYFPFYTALGNLRFSHGWYLNNHGDNPMKEYEKAEGDYSECIRLNPTDYEVWIRRGMVRTNRGVYLQNQGEDPMHEYKKGEDDHSEGIRLNPANYEVWMSRGIVLACQAVYMQNHGKDPMLEYQKAEADYSEGIRLNPTNYEVWMRRGMVRTNRGVYLMNHGKDPMVEYEKAEADYSEGIRLNPTSYRVWEGRGAVRVNRGLYLRDQGKDPMLEYEKAEADYSEGIRLNPSNYEVWVSRAIVLISKALRLQIQGKDPMKEFEKAEADCSEGIRLNPTNYEVRMRRGMVRTNRGLYLQSQGEDPMAEYEKAEADCSEGIRLNPTNYEVWMRRGAVRTNQGVYMSDQGKDPMEEYEKAEKDYERATILNPSYYKPCVDWGSVKFNGALHLEQGGQRSLAADAFDKAAECWQKAIDLNPPIARELDSLITTARTKSAELRQKADKDY